MDVGFRTITTADDDHWVLASLQNLLASSGYDAEAFSSAEHFSARMCFPHALHYSRCRGATNEWTRPAATC
jgi:hypothetical protein